MTTVCLSRSKHFLFKQAYSIAAMADIIPTIKGSKDRTFAASATDFILDAKVLVLLMSSPMDNSEDLRFYFSEEKEIDLRQ